MKRNKILFIPLDGSKPRMVDDIPQEEIDRNKAKVMADIERRKEERLMNRPTNVDWKRIEEFIGYGSVEAPVVFIGVEEGLARPEAFKQDLLWRSSFKPVMDVQRAHEGLADGPSLFSERPRSQPTWRIMADIMLQYDGHRFADPKKRRDERTRYRRIALGHGSGDVLLMELLPYPCKKRGEWLYSDRFPTKEDYVAAILPKRLALLSDVLSRHPRTAIICYGRSERPAFKRLFPTNTRWRTIERQYNTFESATWRGAKVTLTYHFSRFFNTDVRLDELSAAALPRRRKVDGR